MYSKYHYLYAWIFSIRLLFLDVKCKSSNVIFYTNGIKTKIYKNIKFIWQSSTEIANINLNKLLHLQTNNILLSSCSANSSFSDFVAVGNVVRALQLSSCSNGWRNKIRSLSVFSNSDFHYSCFDMNIFSYSEDTLENFVFYITLLTPWLTPYYILSRWTDW